MICASRNDSLQKIPNLNGKYYRGMEEGALVSDQEANVFTCYDGYLDVSTIIKFYQWAILNDGLLPEPEEKPEPGSPLINQEVYSREDATLYYKSQYLYITIKNNFLKEDSYKITYPKTEYYEGDQFNPEGLVVSALNRLDQEVRFEYDSSNLPYGQDIPYFEFSGVNTNSLKTSDTSVSFKITMNSNELNPAWGETSSGFFEYTGTIPITVLKKGLTGLQIQHQPTKLEYFEGETFDPTDLILTGHYNNGTTQQITYDESNKSLFTFSNEPLKSTDTEIEMTYDGITTKIPITVKKVEPTKITIKTLPEDIDYYTGDLFSPKGLEITLHYNNNTTEDITYNDTNKDKFDFSLTELKDTDKEIEIAYFNQKVSLPITVQPLLVDTMIIKELPTQLEYYEEDIFDLSGLIITIIYSNNKTEDIIYSEKTKNDFIFSTNELTLDDKEIEITYKNKTLKQSITVQERYTKDEIKENDIIIQGKLDINSVLIVKETEEYEKHFGIIKDVNILECYEVKLTGKYKGNLQLTFDVGTEHNGKTAYVLHKKKDESIEKFEQNIEDGKVIITVDELSPFIIYIEKEKIKNLPNIDEEAIAPPLHQDEKANDEGYAVNELPTIITNEENISTGDHSSIITSLIICVLSILGIGYFLLIKYKEN